MNYLKFTQYAYLIAGILFAVEAFNQYKTEPENINKVILMGILAMAGVFMFFFRRSFAKKFEERNKNNNQ